VNFLRTDRVFRGSVVWNFRVLSELLSNRDLSSEYGHLESRRGTLKERDLFALRRGGKVHKVGWPGSTENPSQPERLCPVVR
jgi:hypothetical protein